MQGGAHLPKRLAKFDSMLAKPPARPSMLFMGIVMQWMPVELEGPTTQPGQPVTGNLWELMKDQ